jgi:alkanesulfonate monooxygenase SsuD/methylene tetrahydromethanopterin reductase-like flavin-dependent oxidoreductase (luciferase family)
MNHPLRFGIISIQNLPWPTILEHWQHIESLGYDSLWIADHFVNPHAIQEDWFDGWTLLPALATHTSTIRLGTLVTNIIYRNPAVLARQAQTLDHISNGRLELGVGATTERDPSHRMTGTEVWSTSERVGRFREMIEILDQMLRHETTTYTGKYYKVTDAAIRPSSIQRPRPPLTIAAAGPGSLKIAAQYADSWNTFGGWGLSPQDNLAITRQRSEMLNEFCTKIGRDPGQIRHSFLAGVTSDTLFASLDAFYNFVGPLQEIGISEFIFYYDYHDFPPDKCMDRAMLERIAAEALPVLRSKSSG